MKSALIVLALGAVSAFGQVDAGIMAAQQATQQAIQANQQAMDQATIMSQQATINMQQTMANASSSSSCPGPIIGMTSQPAFSVKKGKVAAGTQVRLNSASHYAAIYYTTDGWAPSIHSIRYTGPITINAETHLQAIAIAPNMIHSSIGRIDYTVDAAEIAPPQTPPLITDGILHAGTALRLVTSKVVSSQTAQVGDKIPLKLDQDVKVGDAVIAAKGTSVDGIFVVVDPAGKHSGPGDMVFEVRALNVQGKQIPLTGGETLEGLSKSDTKEAVIQPGMVVMVTVAADTPLKP